MLIKAGLPRMNTVGIVMYASGRNTTKNAAMQMILAVLFLRNIPPSCFPRISCMMTSTAVKRIKSMAIHCLKANTLAICDNDNSFAAGGKISNFRENQHRGERDCQKKYF